MGCGASSIYQEDGAVKAGAGETRMEYDADAPISVMFFWPDGGDDVAIEIKKIIAGPEGAKQKWEKVAELKNGEKTAWVTLPPGDYFHRFVVDNLRTLYPKQVALDLCKKLHVIHKKDEEKYPKQLKKGVEKEKEHPYNQDGGDELAKKDMEAMENFVSPMQMDDRMNKMKDGLTGMEDNLPGNKFSTSASFKTELGHWDKKKDSEEMERVLALPDKARMKGEEELKKPANARKVNVKAAQVMQTGVTKAIEGLCKGLGCTLDELMPTLPDLLDAADGRRPGGTAKPDADEPKEGEEKKEEKKEEEKKETDEEKAAREKAAEDARLAIQKKWFDFDQSKKSEWESADGKSTDDARSAVEKAHVEAYDKLKGIMDKPLDKFGEDSLCIAYYKGKGFAEGRALASGADGVTVEFDENLLEFKDVDTVKPTVKVTVKNRGKDEEIEINGVAAMPPPTDFDEVKVGQTLRCRGEKNDFFNGVVLDKNNDDKTVEVEDKYYQKFTLKADQIYTRTTLPAFALPVVLRPNYIPAEIWWACEEDQEVRKLHIWREGDKDASMMTVDLEKRRAPMKETKKEPNPTGDVFTGYSAKVKLVPERNYCYNFEVGDGQFFVDWKKPVSGKEAYKKFRVTL